MNKRDVIIRNVIIVTDGDLFARRAVEVAASNIGGRCISLSAGSPTWLPGPVLIDLIRAAPYDPVVVMVDDHGANSTGKGEEALFYLAGHPGINVLGVLAVASNTAGVCGAKVDCSVNRAGEVVRAAVNKSGVEKKRTRARLAGDTVDVLNRLSLPVIVGIGDIGKMDRQDDYRHGAPLTTRALKEIIERSGFIGSSGGGKQNQTQ